MTSFDYVIIVVLAASGLLGFVRGLIKELMSLVAFISAFKLISVSLRSWAYK